MIQRATFMYPGGHLKSTGVSYIRRTLGAIGVCAYMDILDSLCVPGTSRLTSETIEDYAYALQTDPELIRKVIQAGIEKELFATINGEIVSAILFEDQKEYERVISQKRAAGIARAVKQAELKATSEQVPAVLSGAEAMPAPVSKLVSKSVSKLVEGVQREPNLQLVATGGVPPPEPEPPPDPFEKYFQQIEPELSTGRRPLKEYPHLFFLPNELKSVLAAFNSRELPKVFFKDVFSVAESEAVSRHAKTGANPAHTNCSSWIMGHILTKFIEQNGQLIRTKKASQPFQKVDNVRPNYQTPIVPDKPQPPSTAESKAALENALEMARNFKAPKAEKSSLVVVSK